MERGRAPAVGRVGYAVGRVGFDRGGSVAQGAFEDGVGPFEPAVGPPGAGALCDGGARGVAEGPVGAVDDDGDVGQERGEPLARVGERPARTEGRVLGDRGEAAAGGEAGPHEVARGGDEAVPGVEQGRALVDEVDDDRVRQFRERPRGGLVVVLGGDPALERRVEPDRRGIERRRLGHEALHPGAGEEVHRRRERPRAEVGRVPGDAGADQRVLQGHNQVRP